MAGGKPQTVADAATDGGRDPLRLMGMAGGLWVTPRLGMTSTWQSWM
jgi:hypothetical protein